MSHLAASVVVNDVSDLPICHLGGIDDKRRPTIQLGSFALLLNEHTMSADDQIEWLGKHIANLDDLREQIALTSSEVPA